MEDIYNYLRVTANLISQTRFADKMVLKDGSALMSKMIENGRTDLYRKTTDIDIHCDKREVWVDLYTNIENILNSNTLGLVYKLTKRRSEIKGLDTSDSLAFTVFDKNNGETVNFKMDMNIKSNTLITVEYSPTLNMSTYDALIMISDKIVVVSSRKIYRRIKDLYDICALVSMYDFSYSDVLRHLNIKHPGVTLENYLTPANFDDIAHAYNKYTGITNKPAV